MTIPESQKRDFIKLRYTGTQQPHSQNIPIKFATPPTPGVMPQLMTKGGTPVDFDTGLELFISAAYREQFNAATVFGFADIYEVDSETGLRQFIYTHNVGSGGAAAGANVPQTQGVWVFKSSVGKPIKVYEMEGVYAPDVRNVGVVPADGRADMVTYMLSDDCIFVGTDDAFPLAFMTFTSKINDVLRRRQGFTNV